MVRKVIPPFPAEAEGGRHARLLAPVGIGGPLMREMQSATGWPDQGQSDRRVRNAHMTIPGLAERPALLPRDTNLLSPLLGRLRIFEREDADAVGAHERPHGPDRLRRIRNGVVQRLVGPRIAQTVMHRWDGLASAFRAEAGQRSAGGIMLHVSTGAVGELSGRRFGAVQNRASLDFVHEGNRRESKSLVQV